MKVTRLRLQNIRCFEDLDIDLGGKSALLVGDNGDGKSTVLRSLAMGLCDDSSASALFRDLYGESVRDGEDSGTITVELRGRSGQFRTVTEIEALSAFERVDQRLFGITDSQELRRINQAQFPWHEIFATGYGPGVRVRGTTDYDYYLAVDALYPLFVYDRPLQNPELVMRRLVAPRGKNHDSAAILTELKSLLGRILQLDSGDCIELKREGISVETGHGSHPLSSLGDGYQTVITIVLDLVSWWYLRKASEFTNIEGVVLIDEVEQHLHPRWQRNIVALLTQSFPSVQFLATTHSPLVASGCEHIPVHRLNIGEHDVVNPFGWRAEEVFAMMGVPSSRAAPFVERLDEFQRLDDARLRGSELSAEEKVRLEKLRDDLARMPGSDPVRLAKELENLARFAEESLGENS